MLAGSNRRFNSGACVFVSYSSDIHSIQFKLCGTLGVVLILKSRNLATLESYAPKSHYVGRPIEVRRK